MKKSENRIHQEIFTWHWNNFPEERGLLFHVNNKAANKIEGARLRSMGMVKGVADMIYLAPNGKAVAIEVKADDGRMSASQIMWADTLNKYDYDYYIVRSVEDFKIVKKELT